MTFTFMAVPRFLCEVEILLAECWLAAPSSKVVKASASALQSVTTVATVDYMMQEMHSNELLMVAHHKIVVTKVQGHQAS